MKLRTEITIKPSLQSISHTQKSLLVGSCFAESIGEKLEYYKFPVVVNPFGILFNPVSIANAFRFICNNAVFSENDLIRHNDLWHSFYHHGSFSNVNKNECLGMINRSIANAHQHLKQASTVIITLGTAYVWEHIASQQIVSNCHKIPSTEFKHYLLSTEAVQQSLSSILENVKSLNETATIIFTVSPIRYMHHGAHNSQLSKATLLLAIDAIINSQNVDHLPEYFPSYELLMDDLRDYRFYAEDMIHPSHQAVEYIWEKFSETYFSAQTITINQKIDSYQKAKAHTILNPNSESGKKFSIHLSTLESNLRREYPFLEW